MSDRIRSSNNETTATQLKKSNSEHISSPSDLRKQTVITNGESYTSNASAGSLSENPASAAKLLSEQTSTKVIRPSASPKPEQSLDSASSSAFDQVQTAITSSAPPLVAPPISDVRDEESSQSMDASTKLVEVEMNVKHAQVSNQTEPGSSDIPTMTDGSNDAVDDSSKIVAKAESTEPMDTAEDARPSGETVELPHRSAPQSAAAESVAGDEQQALENVATAPDPTLSAISPAPEPASAMPSSTDQEMIDPPLSAKLARSRDEEGEDEVGPSAKRSKTDDVMAGDTGLNLMDRSEDEQREQKEDQAQVSKETGSQPSSVSVLDSKSEVKADNEQEVAGADAAATIPHDFQASTSKQDENTAAAAISGPTTSTSQDAQMATTSQDEVSVSQQPGSPSATAQGAAVPENSQHAHGAQDGNSTSTPLLSAHVAPVLEDTPITKAQQKFLLERLRNSKKIKAAAAFLQPVNPVALGIPTYLDIVKTPMDMSTMEQKLKSDQYPTVNAFLADFNTMVQNSATFNGREHAVSQAGLNLQAYFNKGLGDLPPADAPEPVPASKKAKKLTLAATPKATRRESRSSMPAAQTPAAPPPTAVTVATPGSATSPQGTYALQPDGLPLIRRDSAAGDGRPKREIHRPPPRDLPYSAKPKKKKFQLELKFCETVCTEMNKKKYLGISYPFLYPVDPVALNIPTYHKVIKKPMDFGTVTTKLKNGHYENAKEFHADVKLMFDNCFKFNPDKDDINKLGKSFQQLFDSLWSKKDEWITEHAPVSGPQSPVSDEGEDEDEAEDEDDEDDRAAKLLQIQQQISALSAEAQKMFQQSKRTPPKSAGGGSKKDKGGAGGGGSKGSGKASRKSGGSLSGPGGSSKLATKKSKAKPPPITHTQKQEIADAITSLQGQDMLNAIQIIRNGVPSMRVSSNKVINIRSNSSVSFRE